LRFGTLILPQMDALFAFTYQLKSNIQLKHSIYAAFSHFCGIAVNNLGQVIHQHYFFDKIRSFSSENNTK
ncbi:MAG: hypothetical protein J6A77_09300, partial [Lachnospiraceae bacterium]|nr:hypothetical protein [Lachnospiraceae bacterium]